MSAIRILPEVKPTSIANQDLIATYRPLGQEELEVHIWLCLGALRPLTCDARCVNMFRRVYRRAFGSNQDPQLFPSSTNE